MKARLPQLWGVLYASPNVNGEPKSCANCRFQENGATECTVVASPITPDMVCGYHIEEGQLADPELSGLETVPGGTSCSSCAYYMSAGPVHLLQQGAMGGLGMGAPQGGTCSATEGEHGGPAKVDPMGCCARWEE